MKNFVRTSAVLACAVILTAATGAHAAQGDMVRLSQHRLADLGYYSGTFDGVIGPVTAAALRDFQASNRLWVSGQLDANTYNLLVSMDYRLSNGTSARMVYAGNQPVVVHYADGTGAFGTRYVANTMPVAYYNYDMPTHYVTPENLPVAYYGDYDARYTQPVAYSYDAYDARYVQPIAYSAGCYGVSNEGTWQYGNCR